MFGPFEEYVLLKKRALEKIGPYLEADDKFLEELFLATAREPVFEIEEEDLEFMNEMVAFWKKGYAIPSSAVDEMKRIHPALKNIGKDFAAVFRGEDIEVEPDVNFEFAKEFLTHVHSKEILDIASGFGWIPPLFSKRGKVKAIDISYDNKIVHKREGGGTITTNIEGTSIALFPDSPADREYLFENKEEFRTYRDFAMLFWKSVGANLENITAISEDATDMKQRADSVGTVTCFFGLNQIPGWKEVIKEVSRILVPGGTFLISIYREYLERFPVKSSYNWIKDIPAAMIEKKELLKYSKILFELRNSRKKDLFYIIELEL